MSILSAIASLRSEISSSEKNGKSKMFPISNPTLKEELEGGGVEYVFPCMIGSSLENILEIR